MIETPLPHVFYFQKITPIFILSFTLGFTLQFPWCFTLVFTSPIFVMGSLVRRLAFCLTFVGCIGGVMHGTLLGLLRVVGELRLGRGGLVRRRRLRAIRCGSRWVVCRASMVR